MNNYCSLENKIGYICENEYKYFFDKSNVIGVGLGYKIKNSFNTYKKCIKVFVTKKCSNYNLKKPVPKIYKGIPVDIVESSIPKVCGLTNRVRPVLGGYDIGPVTKNAGGTMGCVVTDNHNNFILSCNHIIADYNKLPLGTQILQPSPLFKGKSPMDTIGGLSLYVPVKIGQSSNYVDCAIARILNNKNVSPKIALTGRINGVVSGKLNENVKKVGSTTELTNGKILSLKTTTQILFNGVYTEFKDQIITTKMSNRGDSGSILLNSKNYGIGLMFAETESYTIANNLTRVLNELHVLLVQD